MINRIARFHLEMEVRLSWQLLFSIPRNQDVLRQLTRHPPAESFRRSFKPIRPHHYLAALEKPPLFVDSHRTAILTRPFGIGDVPEAVHHDRKLAFEHFRRNRSVRTETHRCDAVNAVL